MSEQFDVAALVRDLLFSSKITASAKSSGVSLKIVRDLSKLDQIEAGRLIVDLNAPGHLDAAVAWKQRTGGHVIGFASHVAADAIAEARRMGIDRVLSNGGFSATVDALVKGSGTISDREPG
jgi:hypothetical protein